LADILCYVQRFYRIADDNHFVYAAVFDDFDFVCVCTIRFVQFRREVLDEFSGVE
jgi:hypothetical protein